MQVMHQRTAGLDGHKAMIVACVRIMVGTKFTRECRTFDTSTSGLQALLAWLVASGCPHVAMEATGVYWKPVWNILSDGAFELIVANAAHIKNVPSRKTDVNDAMWIADLVAFGLIRASFVPEQELQELRSYMRARKQLVREQTSHIQRIQKTLEEANIKLDSLISDVMGLSGRRMIEAIIAGEGDPIRLAELADRRIETRQHRQPLRERRARGGMGGSVPRQQRERRQTQVLASTKRRPLAQDYAGPMRLGAPPQERQLLQGAVLPVARQARRKESHLRRCRFDTDRDLPHAEGRDPASGSWRRSLRRPFDGVQSQASRGPAQEAWVPGPASALR